MSVPATGAGSYDIELLDMTAAQWNGLSGGQSNAALNVFANPSAVSLWTDSGISGTVGLGISAGKVNGVGGAGGTSAANWGAPTGGTYSTGATDFYALVGWSADLGSSWSAIATALQNSTFTMGALSVVGQSAVYFNQAGGGAASLSLLLTFGVPQLPQPVSLVQAHPAATLPVCWS